MQQKICSIQYPPLMRLKINRSILSIKLIRHSTISLKNKEIASKLQPTAVAGFIFVSVFICSSRYARLFNIFYTHSSHQQAFI